MPSTGHLAITGHYNAVWNAEPLGFTEEGWFVEINLKGEILRFEEFSQNAIDLIHQGADVAVEGVLKEWSAEAVRKAIWPWVNMSADFGEMGLISCVGQFAVKSNWAKPLVLTAESCSPAGSAVPAEDGPNTFTFHRTIMAPEVASRINLNNRPRMIPVRFMCFLEDQGSTGDANRYFTISTT